MRQLSDSMPAAFKQLVGAFSRPLVASGAALVIGGAAIGWAYVATSAAPKGQLAVATQGAITEEVDVSGSVEAAHETSLAFETAGRVSAINVAVGQHVAAGETLATLDAGTENAALASAQATLRMRQADLASLEAGTPADELAAAQASVAAAVRSAYVAADDAVHNRADALFRYPNQSPQLIFANDATLKTTLESERAALIETFKEWQASLATLSDANAAQVAATSETDLIEVETFLDNATEALSEALPGQADAATIAADQSSVAVGRTNVAAAASALASVASALTVKASAATPEDIASAQASVDAASAAVQSAEAILSGAVLVAPVSGTITVQDADLGETVTPGAPLISMVADGKYQAVAQISEADVAKVKVGEVADASFDAYPNVSFPGHVTTVDPAATITDGVPAYGVTITFDANDPRLSSGLPANLRIITGEKDGVLTVPASAVITDATGAFVYVEGPQGPVKTPVVTGLASADGRVEIVSGLSAGARILAYGASASS